MGLFASLRTKSRKREVRRAWKGVSERRTGLGSIPLPNFPITAASMDIPAAQVRKSGGLLQSIHMPHFGGGSKKEEKKKEKEDVREAVTGRSKSDEEFLEKYQEVKEKVQAFKKTEDRLRGLEKTVEDLRKEFDRSKGGPKKLGEDIKRIETLRDDIRKSMGKIETNELKINQFKGQVDHVTNEFGSIKAQAAEARERERSKLLAVEQRLMVVEDDNQKLRRLIESVVDTLELLQSG